MVIATDHRTTFAAFNYADLHRLPPSSAIGFFGDRRNYLNINTSALKSTNLFRIDGKIELQLAKEGTIQYGDIVSHVKRMHG